MVLFPIICISALLDVTLSLVENEQTIMAGKQILSQNLRLKQRLSPLQLMLVPLLEMSGPQIEEKVRRELDDNPALEVKEDAPDSTQETEDGEKYEESSEELLNKDYGDADDMPTYQASNRSANDEYYVPTVVAEDSLNDYLMEQVRENELSHEQEKIAEYIIGNLDDNGYLQRLPQAIADDITFRGGLEVETGEVKEVLDMVRRLDPAGIAAIDLRDCILLQLERKPKSEINELTYKLVDLYFDDLGKRHYDKICQDFGINEEKLKELLAVIQTLNPKPGSAFAGGNSEQHSQQITPDFEIEIDGNNITYTLLNKIPELQISESYSTTYKTFSSKKAIDRSQEGMVTEVKEKYERARDFIDLLRQRQEKLASTMEAIIARQHDFFMTGEESKLHPMVLKDIANDTGLDTSVISRVTRQKYATTPWGVFKLKYFFSEGLGDVSSREVQVALRKLVEGEDKKRPYSDDRLCELLKEKGYKAARRTVAKYREKLGIAESRLRKEL